MPAQPHAASFVPRACGALSVPRKNFGLPEVAASTRASRCSSKEADCGCAGIYTAHAAIELYAIAFEEAHALDKLEAFSSEYGAQFYNLPANKGSITLERKEWTVPQTTKFGDDVVVPLRAGETIPWKLV